MLTQRYARITWRLADNDFHHLVPRLQSEELKKAVFHSLSALVIPKNVIPLNEEINIDSAWPA